MAFTTFDVDNDLHNNNCARNHGNGAFWWGNCGFLNPNGMYGNHGDQGVEFMWWNGFNGDLTKLFEARKTMRWMLR